MLAVVGSMPQFGSLSFFDQLKLLSPEFRGNRNKSEKSLFCPFPLVMSFVFVIAVDDGDGVAENIN